MPGYWCPNGARIDGAFNISGYAPGAPTRAFLMERLYAGGHKIYHADAYNYAAIREDDMSKALFEVDEPSDVRPSTHW